MTKFAFTDGADGYYEVEGNEGNLPVWTEKLTPTAVRVLPVVAPDYKAQRAPLYPPLTDMADAIVKGGQALEDYKAACMAVKALIPKPLA